MSHTETLRCSACQEHKPPEAFARNRTYARGRQWRCRDCNAAYLQERKTDPAYIRHQRDKFLRRRYGIGVDDFDGMLAAQGGVCAVCKRPQKWMNQQYHVDHDHKTGRVRGILCHKCNVALGMVGDSVERLRALVAYLEGEVT